LSCFGFGYPPALRTSAETCLYHHAFAAAGHCPGFLPALPAATFLYSAHGLFGLWSAGVGRDPAEYPHRDGHSPEGIRRPACQSGARTFPGSAVLDPLLGDHWLSHLRQRMAVLLLSPDLTRR